MSSDELIDISDQATEQNRPTRREMQAEQTRSDILEGARHCFALHGYCGTSVKQIAAQAHVSVQTIYDSVGRKQDLVRELHRILDRAHDVSSVLSGLEETSDGPTIVRMAARITREVLESDGDLVRTCQVAIQAEPTLSPLAGHDTRAARSTATAIAQRLDDLACLRPVLTVSDAATSISTLSDRRMAMTLLDDYEMDFDQVEAWITDTITRSVLNTSARLTTQIAQQPLIDLTNTGSPEPTREALDPS